MVLIDRVCYLDELWAAGMKLFEEKAIAQVREKVVPAVVSPGNFYGAVDTALYR